MKVPKHPYRIEQRLHMAKWSLRQGKWKRPTQAVRTCEDCAGLLPYAAPLTRRVCAECSHQRILDRKMLGWRRKARTNVQAGLTAMGKMRQRPIQRNTIARYRGHENQTKEVACADCGRIVRVHKASKRCAACMGERTYAHMRKYPLTDRQRKAPFIWLRWANHIRREFVFPKRRPGRPRVARAAPSKE